jgi:predicted Zn-dependent protease
MQAGCEETAAQVLVRLCELSPRWHFPFLARALLAQQRELYREALTHLRAAQRLAPAKDRSLVHMHLGEVLLCLGNLQEGRKELQSARDLGGDSAAARWASLRLEQLAKPAPRPSRPRSGAR